MYPNGQGSWARPGRGRRCARASPSRLLLRAPGSRYVLASRLGLRTCLAAWAYPLQFTLLAHGSGFPLTTIKWIHWLQLKEFFFLQCKIYEFICKIYEFIYWARGAPQQLAATSMVPHGAILWSDLSWSRADLCTNSYVNSTRFSLLAMKLLCTHYISNVGIKTGLNSFWNFPYVTTFSLRSISVFYLWKTEWFWKELSPSETVIFGPCNFGKRSFSEILDQFNFRKNVVWRKFLDSLLFHLLSKNTWPSTILERMKLHNFFWKAYYLIYLVQTPSRQIRTRTILERIDSEFNSYVKNS